MLTSYSLRALLEPALSTPGILDEYGNPEVGAFFPTGLEGAGTSLNPDQGKDALDVVREFIRHIEATGGIRRAISRAACIRRQTRTGSTSVRRTCEGVRPD